MSHANVAVFVPHVGCAHRCSFCNQNTITGTQSLPNGAFVRAVCEEALHRMDAAARSTAQLAFFGGSFTAIPRPLMTELLEAAQPFLGQGGFGKGIRISTRPDALGGDIPALLARYGVAAVELGAQSMDDTVLQKNGRGHTAAQVEAAAALVKAHGFELGLQIMTGLLGDTDDGAMETARRLAALSPATVRVYPTVVLRGTRLAELFERGEYAPPGVEDAVRLCARLLRLFEGAGVRVIRVGLHASQEVERELLAGGYHPALRELCEARLFLEEMLLALKEAGIPGGAVKIFVPRGCVSKAVGQKKANENALRERGFRATIAEDTLLSGRRVRVERT